MEDALAHYQTFKSRRLAVGLNPCCNGRCTRTEDPKSRKGQRFRVLILVVMEDALALI